jgi:hypothetical protein
MLAVGPHPLVSLPPLLPPSLHERAASWSRSTLEDPTLLAAELAPLPVTRMIGPAFIGYATVDTFRGKVAMPGRELAARDAAAMASLRARCEAEEWEHGGSDLGVVPTFGVFAPGGALAAVAGYETWGDKIAQISIVSAADCRNGGHATAAVALAVDHALTAGLLPQYRTLKSNGPSMRIAAKLGFEEYGISTYLKLAVVQPDVAGGG